MKLKLTGKKMLIFNREVTTMAARKLIQEIIHADTTKGDIYLIINSCGGSAEGGLLVYKTLKSSLKNKLITIAAGEIASAATLMYLAGSKRYVHPGSSFYVHAGSWDGTMPMAELETFYKSNSIKEKDFACICAKNSNISKKKWKKIIQKSEVFTTKQMLKYGIAHELIED
jgi:ATP-dependent Clp protease, protease subunit